MYVHYTGKWNNCQAHPTEKKKEWACRKSFY
jgi:hypothetical protein